MLNRTLAIAAIPLVASVGLVSCWKSDPAQDRAPQSQEAKNSGVSLGDKVAIDYVLKLEDGSVFDSTIAEEAKKGSKFTAKRTYTPIVFVVGESQMPRWLEKGIVGMLPGEKKTVTVSPEEGYGQAGDEVTMAKRLLQDSYRETVSKSKYRDAFETTVPDNAFVDQGKPVPKVGDAISSGGVTSKVTKVEGGLVTLSVDNGKNPFRGKTLAVGLVGDDEGNRVQIVGIQGDNVTVEVKNAANPFAGKELKAWASAMIGGKLHTVKSINGETVVLSKGHELAGKKLVYEVELKEIK